MSKRSGQGSHWARPQPTQASTPETVKKHEKDVARLMDSDGGARRRPGSGSNEFAKGDALSRFRLAEAKQTEKKSIGLTKKWLHKIEREAEDEGKMPFLHFRFLRIMPEHHGMTPDWVVVRARDFQTMIEQINDATDE